MLEVQRFLAFWNSALATLSPGPKGLHGNLSLRSKFLFSTFNMAHVGKAGRIIGSVTFALSDSLSVIVQVQLTSFTGELGFIVV